MPTDFQQIHDVLMQIWDPIGVIDEPLAQDEYDSYVPEIARMLHERRDFLEVRDHLFCIAYERMGLSPIKDRWPTWHF